MPRARRVELVVSLTVLVTALFTLTARLAARPGNQTPSPGGDRQALQALAGEYQAGTITLTVTLLQDGTLTLNFPGQPLYHLERETDLRFRIRELTGFAIEFDRNDKAVISGMTVRQPPPQTDFRAARKTAPSTPTPASAPATDRRALQALAGDYEAGAITLTVTLLQDGTLTLNFPGQPLYHLEQENDLRFRVRELAGFAVEFNRTAAGAINGMTVRQRPPQPDFWAARKAATPPASTPTPPPASDRRALEAFAGEYEAGTITLTVTVLQDATLTLNFPGQPLYHLEQENDLRFRIRELAGFAIEFRRADAGQISGMTVRQRPPQPDFWAARKPR